MATAHHQYLYTVRPSLIHEAPQAEHNADTEIGLPVIEQWTTTLSTPSEGFSLELSTEDLPLTSPSGDHLLQDFPFGVYALAFTKEENSPSVDPSPPDTQTKPRRSSQRTSSNLYTPRWTRGAGAARQGWCGLCQPGRWLDLRNSEYWYDKLYRHGIDSGGNLLPRPKDIRRASNDRGWECLCGECRRWIYLKRAEATWFRHAYDVRSGLVESSSGSDSEADVKQCKTISEDPSCSGNDEALKKEK